jgi:hypothetical protein
MEKEEEEEHSKENGYIYVYEIYDIFILNKKLLKKQINKYKL